MPKVLRRILFWFIMGVPSLILVGGVIVTLKYGWNFVRQTVLLGVQVLHPYKPANTTERVFAGNHNIWPTLPQPGTQIGTIAVPAINLSTPIVQGTSWHDLSLGAGHFEGSMLPGQPGNVVISGHRDTVFTPLQYVKIGDLVVIHTRYGSYTYRVTKIAIVPKTDTQIVVPTSYSQLTLTTCYPFVYIGFAPNRFIVWAVPVTSATSRPQLRSHASSSASS